MKIFDKFKLGLSKSSKSFSSGLTIYRTKGHCWNTPTPCFGSLSSEINVRKKYGYYFIYR